MDKMIKQIIRLNIIVLIVQGFTIGFMVSKLFFEFETTMFVGIMGILISAMFAYWSTIYLIEKNLKKEDGNE